MKRISSATSKGRRVTSHACTASCPWRISGIVSNTASAIRRHVPPDVLRHGRSRRPRHAGILRRTRQQHVGRRLQNDPRNQPAYRGASEIQKRIFGQRLQYGLGRGLFHPRLRVLRNGQASGRRSEDRLCDRLSGQRDAGGYVDSPCLRRGVLGLYRTGPRPGYRRPARQERFRPCHPLCRRSP